MKLAACLAGAAFAKAQQPAQARISATIGWIDQKVSAIGKAETAADDQAEAGRLRRLHRDVPLAEQRGCDCRGSAAEVCSGHLGSEGG